MHGVKVEHAEVCRRLQAEIVGRALKIRIIRSSSGFLLSRQNQGRHQALDHGGPSASLASLWGGRLVVSSNIIIDCFNIELHTLQLFRRGSKVSLIIVARSEIVGLADGSVGAREFLRFLLLHYI